MIPSKNQRLFLWIGLLPCLLTAWVLVEQVQQFDLFLSVQPMPSPYIADWELDPSITLLQIDSDNEVPHQIIVQVIISEGSRGEIASAISFPQEVPEGPWSLTINNPDFFNFEDLHYSPAYDELIAETGRFPDGNYQICASILDVQTGVMYATTCGGFAILSPQPPFLIYPVDDEVVPMETPLFQWTPIAWFSEVQYLLTISEILENQSSQDALDLNNTHFTTEVLGAPNYPYDASAPELIPGQHYAWSIQAVDLNGQPVGTNAGLSEAGSFYFGQTQETLAFIEALSPGGPCSGEVIDGSSSSQMTFTWTTEGAFEEFYIFLCENECGKYYTPTTPGPSTPSSNNPITPSPTTTNPTTTTSRPVQTGVQITPNPYSTTLIADANPLPSNVADVVNGLSPDIGNIKYISNAVPAAATGSTYSHNINLGDFMEPGAAYTYFICGTELFQQSLIKSNEQCHRYTPTDQTTGEPVDDTPCPDEKSCFTKVTELADPAMDGGLKPKYKGDFKIKRDDFIPLGAIGKDYDKVKWECIPTADCKETKSEKTIPLTGKVKFTWAIIKGGGHFVKLGCLPDNLRVEEGDHVIFQPPAIPNPTKDEKIKKDTTIIDLITKDDNPTQPKDADVTKKVTIYTSRKHNSDYYEIKIESPNNKLPKAPAVEEKQGTCKAVNTEWDKKGDLVKPTISLPGVADADKMVVGQWIKLEADDQNETDEIILKCVTPENSECPGSKKEKAYGDNVRWKWKILSGGGKFIKDDGDEGRTVIYEAPKKMPSRKDMVGVKIQVEISNPEGLQAYDKKPEKGEIILKVYPAGVKVSHPPDNWLPRDSNEVTLTSSLVYKEGGTWLPALAHMCRIHFIDLVETSDEPGVCMNAPDKSDKDNKGCPDFSLKEKAGLELFENPDNRNCKEKKDLFMRARTTKPVKTHDVDVSSRDFGGLGFTRSFANILAEDRKEPSNTSPFYESVPVKKSEVRHPDGRPKKTEYKDNRVTVPKDIDENHIADNGWPTFGRRRVADPKDVKEEEDPTVVGDGFKGDGLSAYQEYRGFKVLTPAVSHVRTNTAKKDIFIENPSGLPIALFTSLFEYQTHTINESQYNGRSKRYVNFNKETGHVVDQRGLYLVNGGSHSSLLGIAKTVTNQPAPPNWVRKVIVYKTKVEKVAGKIGINAASKLSAVTAHELGHACNTYHHGKSPEGSPGNKHGVCSGNISCIMRYDNRCEKPEAIGSILCTSAAGTGYNAGDTNYGNAATGLGNCKAQHRVSGKGGKYPDRSK